MSEAEQGDWQGQIVRAGDKAIYLSLLRDVTAQPASGAGEFSNSWTAGSR